MCRPSNSSAKAAKVVVLSHMEVVYGRIQEATGTLSRCLAPVNTAQQQRKLMVQCSSTAYSLILSMLE